MNEAKLKNDGWTRAFEAEVQFADIDMNLHVNNCTPVRWTQEGRVRFIKSIIGEYLARDKLKMIVRSLTTSYEKEIFFGDRIVVYVKIGEFGNGSSWNLLTSIWSVKQQQVVVTSTARMVQFDPATHKKVNLSDEIKDAMKKYQGTSNKITSKL